MSQKVRDNRLAAQLGHALDCRKETASLVIQQITAWLVEIRTAKYVGHILSDEELQDPIVQLSLKLLSATTGELRIARRSFASDKLSGGRREVDITTSEPNKVLVRRRRT